MKQKSQNPMTLKAALIGLAFLAVLGFGDAFKQSFLDPVLAALAAKAVAWINGF